MVKSVKARVLGDPEQKALERALARAFAEIQKTSGYALAEFDINLDFWSYEGAEELAKLLLPGAQPSAAGMATRAVASLGRFQTEDEQLDRINLLRPVFRAMLDALANEVRREPALRTVLGLRDEADGARAGVRLAHHLGAATAGEDDRFHYLSWVVDQHRYLPTVGVVRNTTVQLPLDDVFIGLQAQADQRPGDRARHWFEQERAKLTARVQAGQLDETGFEAALDRLQLTYGRKFPADGDREAVPAQPVLDVVHQQAQLLVLGDPGSGKTTLLRYLALTHAKALVADTSPQDRPPLFPIYLRIGEYARHGHPDHGIGEFLAVSMRRDECRTPGLSDLLQRQLDGGRCLVLLDGLDEIASADLRRDVVAAVVNFVTAHARQGNRFVVTSRIAGYQAAPLPDSFHAVRLQDMDDPTIGRFLDVYCREVERAETPKRTDAAIRDAGAREATAIGEALRTNPGVRRLAANPLLLTALVLVHRSSGRLPHRRVEAYIEVCNALGRTWRSAQGVAAADLPDERILNRWLSRLGAWLHENRPEGAASKLELLEVLGPLWATHHGSSWDPDVLRDADPLHTEPGRGVLDFVRKADEHTGLLVERAPGRYGFAHLTFEEYYTGRALALLGSIENRASQIRRRLHDPRYDEPILLALGLIGTDYVEQIDEVIAQAIYPGPEPSPYEDLLGRDFLFMLRVLADDVPLARTATIDEILHQAIDEYLDPDASRCRFTTYRQALAERLSGLGDTRAADRLRVALDARATTIDASAHERWCELVEIAVAYGQLLPTTRNMLVQIAGDGAHADAALRVLGRDVVVSGEVVAALVVLAVGGGDPEARVRAMELLAGDGALSGEVVAAAVGLATGDMDPIVRLRAVEVLARSGALNGEVIAALMRVATGGGDPFVRVRAVEVLAASGALGGEVVAAAVGLATGGGAPFVRLRAVELLARNELLTGGVVSAAVGLATGDGDPFVRVRAVEVLAASGALGGEVVAAAVGLATGDGDPFVRLRAVESLARNELLTGEVVAAAVGLATAGDPVARVRAVEVLAGSGALGGEVVAALVGLATGGGDPEARVRAGELLVENGALSGEVVAALVGFATGGGDPFVRLRAVEVLASNDVLTGEVVAALVGLATGGGDPEARVRAVEVLAGSGALGGEVVAALVGLATGGGDPFVRLRAVEVLAWKGALSGEVVAALVGLATGDGDPKVRVRAVELSATGDALSGEVVAAAVGLATGGGDPAVRVRAMGVLAAAGALAGPVAATALEVVGEAEDWLTRQDLVRHLRYAPPTERLITVLMSLFLDPDNDVRAEVGRTLVEISRRHPEVAADIRSRLVSACASPDFAEQDEYEYRAAWDYAHEALQRQVEAAA
ncbi:NACHT domain-containing protein [Micromonospora zingiberis]|uniref:NACHT domain-containing protein n=1 Tax=Micromonospora zingiberis TaxID=2053011 RepID=UPI0013F44FDE|nr:NACHT domain-containing protein [Micromonospora zingiberis]